MKVALLDCEATDKKVLPRFAEPDKQTKVIEVALFIVDGDKVVDKYDTLVRYNGELDERIVALTGIQPKDLEKAEPWEDVRKEVVKRLEGCDRVVAHNASFDCSLMDSMPGGPLPWPEETICTVEATEHLKGYRLKQSALYTELFDKVVDEETLHRASNDVDILVECYIELVKRGEIH